jgi:hypothetical protein
MALFTFSSLFKMQKKFTRSIKNPVSRISNALSDLIKYRRYRTLHVLVTIAYFNERVKGIKRMPLINRLLKVIESPLPEFRIIK